MDNNTAQKVASPFLTETQAAKRLGLAPKTLRNWRYLGGGPSFLRLGSSVRYYQDDVDAWALNQRAVA